MCGICGFSGANNKELLKAMTQCLEHRGPDGVGFFEDKNISLGHRRLKIIDLSEKGKQPMKNEDGSVWVVFNGEIYNFKELRNDLEKKGHKFFSATDTEVIVHAYEEWGEKCVEFFDGMFAIAIWDSNKKRLFLARDPLGIKPIYYAIVGKELFFASEIKALLENAELVRTMNKKALNELLNFRVVLFNHTMFEGIYKLLPGTTLVWENGKKEEKKYWNLGISENKRNAEVACKEFFELFENAVGKRLVSDVPVGTYLSGGVDSSAITALMSKMVPDLKTFTVGFGQKGDELSYAKQIAEKFSTNHSEVIVNFKEMTQVLPKLVWNMDEPMADIAFVPVYFLTKAAKKKITVALLGEGADEVFAGYERYWKTDNSFNPFGKKQRVKNYLQTDMAFRENEKKAVLKSHDESDNSQTIAKKYFNGNNFLNDALLFDTKEILPNYQLTRVDRVTMSCGLEARVPFLDKKIVEYAFKLDPKLKLGGKTGKFVVKNALKGVLPKTVLEERKRIFFIPLKQWFKESLKDLAQNLLEEKTVKKRGLFDYGDIKRKFFFQRAGVFENRFANQLLMLSMIEIWHRTFIDQEKVPTNGLKISDLI